MSLTCDLTGEIGEWQTRNRVPLEPGWNMWVLAVRNEAFSSDKELETLVSKALLRWFSAPLVGRDGVDSLAMGPRSDARPVASKSKLLRRTEEVPGPGPTLKMSGGVSYVWVAFVNRKTLLDLAWPVYSDAWTDSGKDCPLEADLMLVEARVPPANVEVPPEPTSTIDDIKTVAEKIPAVIIGGYMTYLMLGGAALAAYLALRKK